MEVLCLRVYGSYDTSTRLFTKKFSLKYWTVIQLTHYLIIMPGLLYIAYKQKFSDQVYDSILGLGIGIAGYHGYKYYKRLNKK